MITKNCEHNIVLEIYTDETHSIVSHYRCVNCGETQKERFGKEVISPFDFK